MKPTCRRCVHYFITWEVDFPHGCRAMGFKSRRLPIMDVRRAMQGQACLSFEKRKMMKPQRDQSAGRKF